MKDIVKLWAELGAKVNDGLLVMRCKQVIANFSPRRAWTWAFNNVTPTVLLKMRASSSSSQFWVNYLIPGH